MNPMYKWKGMTIISYMNAIERFKQNEEVFLLYDDDSEGLVEQIEQIHEHKKYGGEFGIEK